MIVKRFTGDDAEQSVQSEIYTPALLIPGTKSLFESIVKFLDTYQVLNNPKLTAMADRIFHGTVADLTYGPRDAYDVMEIAINHYLTGINPDHAMSLKTRDVKDVLEKELYPLLDRIPRQTIRTEESRELQQFSTPPTLAFACARLLNPQPTDLVLEPSAGTGSLAVWARAFGAKVICNEIDSRRRALLTEHLGFECERVDAEILNDVLNDDIKPSMILMNPPFSATGGRVIKHSAMFGARHIESALRRLRPGGRLVAIAGASMSFSRPSFTEWWQKIAQQFNVRCNFTVSGREYTKYGASFDLQIIRIDKTGRTPGDTWQKQLKNVTWGEADSLLDAWGLIGHLSESGRLQVREKVDVEEDKTEGEIFVPYVTSKLVGGIDHPAVLVESSSMAAVQPPDITYKPSLPPEMIGEGNLSRFQLESIIYAGQRHEQRLQDGARSGFFVGHGTGAGKGRILAGIILDNWFQGRRRAVWFSVNQDLLQATRDDFRDLGMQIPLARINDYKAGEEIDLQAGVIFSTYSSLIAQSREEERRFDQLVKWLGTDGVVICDEAHKAKNALASGRGDPTQTGQAIVDLQSAELYPDFRVVYSSATGATDVRNMAYMTRLGLWGSGTSFPSGFNEFMNEIDAGGMGAMEMVCRDMKSLGMYLSGSLSYGLDPKSGKAVEYRETIHRLTDQQREMYDCAAGAWQVILLHIEAALEVTNAGKRQNANAKAKFWGDHQRFFRQMIVSFKIPSIVQEIQTAISNNRSVVISLVGTAEARTKEQIAKTLAAGGSLEDLDFSPAEIIYNMIERGFPTQLFTEETDSSGKTIKVPVFDQLTGEPVHSKEALAMKQSLIDSLSVLVLPENPLDQLVNHFGKDNVAEITGRQRRLIRTDDGRVEYNKRVPDGVPMHQANLYEMDQFQNCQKRIAIISDAGSMGISLHASNRRKNTQRRLHITLELGWSADKEMQRLGRTHRSDQAVPPEYLLMSTELAGEKRFSSTIARRLGSLGAITKGDRGAADSSDLAKYNYETSEGRAALTILYRRIMQGDAIAGLDEPRQTLRDIGLIKTNSEGLESVKKEDETNIPRFLNRILALTIEPQNALFDYFDNLFIQTVSYAKANGSFDEGVTDIKALAVRIAYKPQIVYEDKLTGAETTHYTLEIETPSEGVSFTESQVQAEKKGGFYFEQITKKSFALVIPSGQHTNAESGLTFKTYAIWRPEGARMEYINDSELQQKYAIRQPEQVSRWWNEKYLTVPKIEKDSIHIISGAIIPIWSKLKTKDGNRLKVVRVTTEDGQRVVGAKIATGKVGTVLRALGVTRTLRDPAAVLHAVLHEGEVINLVSNFKLRPSANRGTAAIELIGAQSFQYPELRRLRLSNYQDNYKQRFFIPSHAETGLNILTGLMAAYPIVSTGEDDTEELVALPVGSATIGIQKDRVRNIDEWLLAGWKKPFAEEVSEPMIDAAVIEPAAPVIEMPTPVVTPVKKGKAKKAVAQAQLAFNFE